MILPTAQAPVTGPRPAESARKTRRPRKSEDGPVTILDVARACGVSTATVSRVLNGKDLSHVSDAIRTKVFGVARAMKYVPNLAARHLNQSAPRTVALFAPPLRYLSLGNNQQLLQGATDVLYGTGVQVRFEMAPIPGSATAAAGMPAWPIDGALVMQETAEGVVAELGNRGLPYVCVNERAGTPRATVLPDEAVGIALAVDHLIGLGHRRLAYANARAEHLRHFSVEERHQALLGEVRARRLSLRGDPTPFDHPAHFLAEHVLRDGATAVLAYDHQIAAALIGAAWSMGLRVPKDFSLVCFNDVFPVAVLDPALTVIRVPGLQIGRVAAEELIAVLEDRAESGAGRVVRLAPDFVVRASTAPPPADAMA